MEILKILDVDGEPVPNQYKVDGQLWIISGEKTIEEEIAAPPAPSLPGYFRKRPGEYPTVGDQLDSLFHAGVFPEDMTAKIQAIKDKYPKE
tara:strand:- start:240 stop:512 length:273 start_codon:yes stop_codon:yes gene_type:complete